MLKIEKNAPPPRRKSKEIVETILQMNDGDGLFISYDDFTKTEATNGIANARLRIYGKGLRIVSKRESNGTRIWVNKVVA